MYNIFAALCTVIDSRYTTLPHKHSEESKHRSYSVKEGFKHFDTNGLNSILYEIEAIKEEFLFTSISINLHELYENSIKDENSRNFGLDDY